MIGRAAPGRSGGVRVLLYHAIDDPHPADCLSLRVSRRQFLDQMAVLRDDAYAVVPLDAVFHPQPDNGRLPVAITFDDGYRTVAWAAAVLKDFGFPATFFVVPRFLDGVQSPAAYWEEWAYLTWGDLAALADHHEFAVGAHSTTHLDLRRCADARLAWEISEAKLLLERRIGRAVTSFSYPFGRHDRRVRRAVERAGYELACTSRYGLNRSPGSRYAVHRTEVAGRDSLRDFHWKLRGKYDWLAHWQDLGPLP
ncbi:MAG: hypothetical protein A3I61_20080 [Acidobacteria bacterium RIFCSPLOWO2_02_FULL_68_18]|nr:MAG: hypothetical protein A3I61_20080 [Acidobacteria bacterium RIFCSPLOWO2_02_FULL_68_18]